MATGWWAEIHTSFGLALSPSLGFAPAITHAAAAFGLTLQPEITMGAAGSAGVSEAAFGLALTPQLGMTAAPVGKAAFGLAVSPQLSMIRPEPLVFAVSVTPQFGMGSGERYSRTFGVSVAPQIGMVAANPPVEFDAVGAGYGSTGTPSWQHTATAGSYVIVDAVLGGDNTASAATYGGASMTQTASVDCGDTASAGRLFRFELANAPGGEQTVEVTRDGSAWATANSVSLTGTVSGETPVTASGSGVDALQGPVSRPANGLIVQSFANSDSSSGSTPFTNLSGGTNRYNSDGTIPPELVINTAGETTTFTAETGSSWPWAGIVTALEPAVVTNIPVPEPRLTLTETGLDFLSVMPTGEPTGIGTLAGWNYYLDGVKDNASLVTVPEWTFTGLTDGTEYNLTYTAVDDGSVESSMSEELVASTLANTALSQTDRDEIDSIVAAAMSADNLPGVQISIRGGVGDYNRAYGHSNHQVGPYAMGLGMHFRMQSVTKSFTATAVLQQIDAENLSLSDTVDTYVADVPNGDTITVEHLLMMRAGLPSYDTGDIATTFFLNGTLDYDEHDALTAIRDSTPEFAPGADYLYSNSNYILLGFILESVTGEDIRTVVGDVITAAGLSDTSWPQPPNSNNYYPPDPYSDGFMSGVFGGQSLRSQFNPDFLGAAGGLVTTISDLRLWSEVMRDGTLLSPTMQTLRESTFGAVPYEMEPGPDEFGFGYGIIQFGAWYGMDGSYPGYECCTFYHPASGAVIATMANFQSSTLSAFSNVFANIAEYLYPGTVDTLPTQSAAFGVAVTPQIGMAGHRVGATTFGLDVSPQVGFSGSGTDGVLVEHDATSAGAADSAASVDWPHTATGNAVVVGAAVSTFSSPTVGADYGSQAMTLLGSVTQDAVNLFLFGLLDPPGGQQTVTVTDTGGGGFAIAGSSVSYHGVDSFGTPVTDSAASDDLALTVTSGANHMVAQAFAASLPSAGSMTITGYDQNERAHNQYDNKALLQGDAAGASSVSFSAHANNAVDWAGIGVDLIPAS